MLTTPHMIGRSVSLGFRQHYYFSTPANVLFVIHLKEGHIRGRTVVIWISRVLKTYCVE